MAAPWQVLRTWRRFLAYAARFAGPSLAAQQPSGLALVPTKKLGGGRGLEIPL